MKGYITRRNDHWYVVIYEGLDPTTGKERRRWHAAGTDRTEAEVLARRLADEELERRGTGRSRLTLAAHIERTWLPRKARQLRAVNLDGYRRQLRLYILPTSALSRCGRCGWSRSRTCTSICSRQAEPTARAGWPPSPCWKSTCCCATSSTTR